MLTERQLWNLLEGETIRSLLSGNDTGCFTTGQYAEAEDKVLLRWTGAPRPLDCPAPNYRRKLLALSPIVVEVRPDVWALASALG